MMESLANKEERHQAEGLTLRELEGQTAEVLPNRLEMHRHHGRRITIINIDNRCTFATFVAATNTGPQC
jgi:hypothetical protein